MSLINSISHWCPASQLTSFGLKWQNTSFLPSPRRTDKHFLTWQCLGCEAGTINKVMFKRSQRQVPTFCFHPSQLTDSCISTRHYWALAEKGRCCHFSKDDSLQMCPGGWKKNSMQIYNWNIKIPFFFVVPSQHAKLLYAFSSIMCWPLIKHASCTQRK